MSVTRRLYFDNAATSFPKPPEVAAAMADYATRLGASPGRGSYAESTESAGILASCRARLNTLINGESPDHVIFTLNTSDALNLGIRGLLEPMLRAQREDGPDAGDPVHVVTTDMDHNSILRPLAALRDRAGLAFTRVPADPATGLIDPEAVRRAITPSTKLVASLHASNVTGTIQPVGAIGAICRDMAVPFLVDAAQSVGHIPVDVRALNIDLLAAPGHKGLLGPLGTGFLYMRPGMERLIDTVREGGTGSVSEQDTQPTDLPDKYEPGSHNTIGIAGLDAGVKYLLERTIEDIVQHERSLIEQFIQGLHQGDGTLLPGLRLLGPQGVRDRVGVFSITVDGLASGELATRLERDFGVLTRAGLHCAPHVHRTFKTDPDSVRSAGDDPAYVGATRFSVGPFLTVQDVKYATDALATICEDAAVSA